MSRLPDDLARFLFLVPYVAGVPEGVPVADLCERLSCSPAQLHRLIERVATVGTPDGAPDELVELYLEGGRVHVALPQRFTRPPRFSVEEMLALLVALAPLREAELPQLRARAQALTDRLLGLASERASAVAPALLQRVVVAADGTESAVHLRDLERAVRERREVDAVYYTAGRDAVGARRLRPVGLLQVRGAWYVVGDDGKAFKVERFRSVELREETFESGPVDLGEVRRRLEGRQPEGAPTQVVVRVDGDERRLPLSSEHTLRRWVRASRGQVVVREPAQLREAVLAEVRALLRRYEEDAR